MTYALYFYLLPLLLFTDGIVTSTCTDYFNIAFIALAVGYGITREGYFFSHIRLYCY